MSIRSSLIAARLLQTWKIPDAGWFEARMRAALRLRERLYPKPYYRLVYGESDGLPGLVVDRYWQCCVVQIGTAGMELLKPEIQEALRRVLRCEVLFFKNDSAAREMEGLPSYDEAAMGAIRRSRRSVVRTGSNSRRRWRPAKRPAGSSIRPATVGRCRSTFA